MVIWASETGHVGRPVFRQRPRLHPTIQFLFAGTQLRERCDILTTPWESLSRVGAGAKETSRAVEERRVILALLVTKTKISIFFFVIRNDTESARPLQEPDPASGRIAELPSREQVVSITTGLGLARDYLCFDR